MDKKSRAINLSISETDKAWLEKIAIEFGMKWGERPNISKLVEAIARRQLVIAPNNDWPEPLITAMKQAVDALTDAGETEEALMLADLLLQRSELSLPLRAELERFLGNPPPAWRIEINRYIHCQKPFQFSYQDATGKLWSFTVRHAKIVPHEERQYLDCWCEETEGNSDLEPLCHNWSLRLDKISEAGVFPVTGKWCPTLAELPVEMHMFGRLAFAYKTRNEDTESELLPGSPPVRRVVKRVSSTYWFIREVLREVPDIVIVSPSSVRERLKQKIISLYERYTTEN